MLQKRKAAWRGIRRHGTGWQIEVRVTGHPRVVEQFPIETDRGEMQQRRAAIKETFRRPSVGSFAKRVADYLSTRKTMPTIAERTRHMQLWVKEFGARSDASIQPWEIAAVRDRWLTEGPKLVTAPGGTRDSPRLVEVKAPLSASQVNQRLRALENFYTVMNRRHGYNPVREVAEAKEPASGARGLPYDVIEQVIAALRQLGKKGEKRDSLTALRLRVFAYTGLSHGELQRIGKADLHLEEDPPWVWVAGRSKGKGTRGTAQPMTPAGAAALRALAETPTGLEPFSRASMWKSFARACRRLGLSGLRPYDLRHSFASEVLEKTGGNLPVTQLLMRHLSAKTTLRYAEKAIDPVRAAALEQVRKSGAFAPSIAPASDK